MGDNVVLWFSRLQLLLCLERFKLSIWRLRNRNNKEMDENVFSRESSPGLLDTSQMPYH